MKKPKSIKGKRATLERIRVRLRNLENKACTIEIMLKRVRAEMRIYKLEAEIHLALKQKKRSK